MSEKSTQKSPSKITPKRIAIYLLVILGVALFIPKPCDNYDGWSGPDAKRCTCLGVKIPISNLIAIDGDYISFCMGIPIPKPGAPVVRPPAEEPENSTEDITEEDTEITNEDATTEDTEDTDDTEVEISNIPTRRFYVRLSPDADISFYMEAELIQYAIEYHEGPGGGAATIIVLSDPDLGNSELGISIPHISFPEPLTEITLIENPYLGDLYRISEEPIPTSDFSYRFFYSNEVTTEEGCEGMGETVPAPCGNNIVRFSEEHTAHIFCETDSATPYDCDEAMETLRLAE